MFMIYNVYLWCHGGGRRAHDVEGRVPGLIVGRGQRERPPVQHDLISLL